MRNIFLYCFLASGFLLSACSSDSHDVSKENGSSIQMPIRLGSSNLVSASTRAETGIIQDALFDNGTVLDVFVTDLAGTNAYDTPKLYYVTGTETDTEGTSINTLAVTDGAKQYYTDNAVSFTAFYPNGWAGTSATGSQTFTVASEQGTSNGNANYKGSDLMGAYIAKQEPTGNEVVLPFRHLLTRVAVKVEIINGFEEADIRSIKLRAKLSANVNKETLSATATGDAEELTLSSTSGESFGYAILPPQVIEANVAYITVELAAGKSGPLYYKPKDPITLRPGYSYYIKLNASNSVITGYNYEIASWPEPAVTGETGTGDDYTFNETDYVQWLRGWLETAIAGRVSVQNEDDERDIKWE